MLIIGSTAIKHWFPDFNREPKDIDVIRSEHLSNSSESISVKDMSKPMEILDDPGITKYQQSGYLKPDLLLTLKCSHIFWDINHDKHMWDIQFLLKKGCKIDKEIFYELYEFWNTYHTKNRRSDLNMTAEEFFDNALDTVIDHDIVHTFLKDVPTYTKVLADGEEVLVSEEKFNKLSHQEKLDLVIEEVQVMAWERYKKVKWYVGYSKMLKKFLMNHAPMWEALFMIEHWTELVKCPEDFYSVINKKLEIYERRTN